MRKLFSILLVVSMLAALSSLAVQAEDWEDEEEDISFYDLMNPPTPVPDPNATPGPTFLNRTI